MQVVEPWSLHAGRDLISLERRRAVSAKGGDGRADGIYDRAEGGSGGAGTLLAKTLKTVG